MSRSGGKFAGVRPCALGCVLGTFVLVGCGNQADHHPPLLDPNATEGQAKPLEDSDDGRLQGGDCPVAAPTGQRLECGTLSVPRDYQNPSAGTLKLSVMVFKGGGSQTPVVYLDGGPGGAAHDTVSNLFDRFEPLLQDRDLVVLDQRGTGNSTPLPACPNLTDDIADSVPEGQQAQVLAAEIAKCSANLKASGLDPSVFTTHADAADVDQLRQELGYTQWNLFGVSYGTRLALEVMRDFPNGVNTAVLDSVLPPQIDWLAGDAVNAEHAFTRIFAHCAAQPACNAAYPDLESTFYALIQKLSDNPVSLALSDGTRFNFDGDQAVELFFLLSYDAEAIALMPEVISEFDSGDYRVAQTLENEGGGLPDISIGMYLSVVCSEYAAYSNAQTVDAANAGVRPAIVHALSETDLFDYCAAWNVPAAPASERQAVSSSIPTLVLSGAYDPVTPGAWGELVSQTLSSSFFVSFERDAHGVFADECGATLLNSFWKEPGTNPADTCPERDSDLDFYIASGGVTASSAGARAALSLGDGDPQSRILRRIRHWPR